MFEGSITIFNRSYYEEGFFYFSFKLNKKYKQKTKNKIFFSDCHKGSS